MNIQDTHDLILLIINKEQNAYFSHEEIDAVLDRAQLALFNDYHTNPKIPAQVQSAKYGESQRIDDALSIFKNRFVFTTANTAGGVITLPNDYMHLNSLYTTQYSNALQRNTYQSVQVLNEEELIERLESQIIPVTPDDPIAIMNSQNRIQLFPEVASSGGVYYFRRPLAPKFAYTQSGRTITYNAGSSVNLEWRDYDVMNIISKAISYYGISMSAGDVQQFAEVKNNQGQ